MHATLNGKFSVIRIDECNRFSFRITLPTYEEAVEFVGDSLDYTITPTGSPFDEIARVTLRDHVRYY